MKKLVCLCALMCMASGAVVAAENDSGVITINCSTELSVEVSTSTDYLAGDPGNTIAIGEVDTNITCVAPISFKIWNTSPAAKNTVQTYQLNHDGNDTNWAYNNAGFAGGLNTMALGCIFASAAPVAGAYGADHLVTNIAATWSATQFDNDSYASNQHYNSNPGHPEDSEILLWPAIKTPTAISTTATKTVTITVTAVAP